MNLTWRLATFCFFENFVLATWKNTRWIHLFTRQLLKLLPQWNAKRSHWTIDANLFADQFWRTAFFFFCFKKKTILTHCNYMTIRKKQIMKNDKMLTKSLIQILYKWFAGWRGDFFALLTSSTLQTCARLLCIQTWIRWTLHSFEIWHN